MDEIRKIRDPGIYQGEAQEEGIRGWDAEPEEEAGSEAFNRILKVCSPFSVLAGRGAEEVED